MRTRVISPTIVSLGIVFATPLLAQQPGDTTTLRPVVITATRIPVDRRVAPASVTVLGGDQLRSRGIATVADALASVPGMSVVRSGSFGATTALFARGGESDYVKVLIDGVPVNAPGGGFDFSALTTDNLERIEVVRGPASVVHGSDAVSGVVQLFTRQGHGPPRAHVDLRAGSYGTVEGGVGLAGGGERIAYSIGAAARETDGVFAFNNDHRNRVGSGRVAFRPSFATIDVTARRTDATYHFPTNGSGEVVDSNGVRRDRRTSLGVDLSRRLTPAMEMRVLATASRLDGGSSNQPDSPGDSTGLYGRDDERTERRAVDVRADYRPGARATISLGAAVERQQSRSTSESRFGGFPPLASTFSAHRTNEAVYAQVIGLVATRFTYTASARVDDDASYGAFVTGRGSLAWQATAATSVRAAIGNAFKSPAFNETFTTAFTIGNPGLEPERTVSWEASIEHRVAGSVSLSATYFDQRFRDLIQYVEGDASTEFLGTNENLAAALARGVELEARAPRVGAFDLAATATLLTTRVTDAGNGAFGTFVNGERLLRRPARSATFDAAYRAGRTARVGAAVRIVGERDDRDFDEGARVTLPSYTLLDLSAEVALENVSRALAPLTLTARVENALDRAYQPSFGFSAPGRTVLLGARLHLGGSRE